jgi:hypothetical protein
MVFYRVGHIFRANFADAAGEVRRREARCAAAAWEVLP